MPTRKKVKKSPAKKRTLKKKPIKKKATRKGAPLKKAQLKKKAQGKKGVAKEDIIGVVTHYFPKVRAAVVKLKNTLSAGDVVKIKGHTTDFAQTVSSLQIDHVAVDKAIKGQEIGLLVDSRVREHDLVLKGQ